VPARDDRAAGIFQGGLVDAADGLGSCLPAQPLGIHVKAAIQWQKISAGTGPPTPPISAAGNDDPD
jgi:hypothetical protein